MAVGLLLVTHPAVGSALMEAAEHVLGRLPVTLRCAEVPPDADPQAMLRIAAHRARQIDQGDGILILTDAFGATPSNVASRLGDLGINALCVSGLNLPMLLRTLNYAERALPELADTAASGGRNGIKIHGNESNRRP